MGIIIASAVIPIALTLCWSKQNATAVVVAPAVGFVCGLTTWLVVAKSLYGEVTVASTGMNMPMLSGNLVSLLLPFFITVPWSLMYPQNYDFETTRKISVLEDEKDDCELEYNLEEEEDPEALNKALKFAYSCAWVLTFILIFLWPLPMLGEKYVFTWQFFTLWVSVGFIWALIASAVCIFYPIIEAKDGIMIICKGIVEDAKGDLSSQPICVIMYTYVYIHINVHTYIYTKNL
jgi:Na+/proline symporter